MVSRKDVLKETANLIGVAAAHFVLFGDDYPEGLLYRQQAIRSSQGKNINDEERESVLGWAIKRGKNKIEENFRTPGKTRRFGFDETISRLESEINDLIDDIF